MNVALDTNVLAYAEGVNGTPMKAAAIELIERLVPESTFIPIQALGELFHLLVRKAGRSRAAAGAAVLSWGDAFPLIETSPEVLLAATSLSDAHQLGVWDSIILSAAADARCRLLLSEDLQEGFTWRGVTVTNPFAQVRHTLLDPLLRPARKAAPKTSMSRRRRL
jgi:predicted nucleic acid-binding protein